MSHNLVIAIMHLNYDVRKKSFYETCRVGKRNSAFSL